VLPSLSGSAPRGTDVSASTTHELAALTKTFRPAPAYLAACANCSKLRARNGRQHGHHSAIPPSGSVPSRAMRVLTTQPQANPGLTFSREKLKVQYDFPVRSQLLVVRSSRRSPRTNIFRNNAVFQGWCAANSGDLDAVKGVRCISQRFLHPKRGTGPAGLIDMRWFRGRGRHFVARDHRIREQKSFRTPRQIRLSTQNIGVFCTKSNYTGPFRKNKNSLSGLHSRRREGTRRVQNESFSHSRSRECPRRRPRSRQITPAQSLNPHHLDARGFLVRTSLPRCSTEWYDLPVGSYRLRRC
jgi:hypothetical protein